MAKREPIELAFGDRTFRVRPLTFGQVEKMEALFASQAGMSSSAVARDAVKIALSRDDAAVDITELEVDVRDLPDQLAAIMRLGGFLEGSAGEAPAAAGSDASNGNTSAVA